MWEALWHVTTDNLLICFPHYNPAHETTFKESHQIVTLPKKLSHSLIFWSLSVAFSKRIRSYAITMPEARDRIQKPVDYSAIFVNRRSNGLLLDDPASRLNVFESPVQRFPSDTQVNPETVSIGGRSMVGTGRLVRGNYSTWRPGNTTGHSSFRLSQGTENLSMGSARRGKGRASPSVLPSWYPRTPLRDITHIIRAIERKRGAGMGVCDGREIEIQTESPVPLSGEQKCSMVTPGPSIGFKRSCPPSSAVAKVHKMLLDITKEIAEEEEAGFITPEKKLLNSIDKVEKIVMEKIQKLKNTPLAKREEREKSVRTLMSMR